MNAEKIWVEYRARIEAFLRSKISNSEDVEDLLQEISIKTFLGISTLSDQSKVKPWLFQTAHRTIIDFYRKNGRTKDIHPDDLWYFKDAPEIRNQLERCVEPFINALPSKTAKLLRAIDLEGQSQKDYATAHGVPYSTLKTRVKNGRAALRSVFDNCCKFTVDSRGHLSEYHSKSDICEKC